MANELFTTVAEADARYVSVKGEPSDGALSIDRHWAKIDAQYADTLVVALNAIASYTNPQVDAQTYTGKFANASPYAKEDGTRAIDIGQALIKITAIANVDALAALTPLLLQNNEIITLFDFEEGEGDDITYIYRNLDPASRTTVMDISDSDLVSHLPGAGWSYADRHWKNLSNNTAEFSAVFRKVSWTNISGTTPNQVIDDRVILGYKNYNPQTAAEGHNVQKIDGGRGLPIAQAEEVRDNETSDSGYSIDSIQLNELGNGQASIQKTQTKQRAIGSNVYRFWRAATGGQPEHETVIWLNLTSANATLVYNDAKTNTANMAGATYAASPATHLLKNVERQPLGNELFNVVRVTWIPYVTGTAWLAGPVTRHADWVQYRRFRGKSDNVVITRKRVIRLIETSKQMGTLANITQFLDSGPGIALGPYVSFWAMRGLGQYYAKRYTLDAAWNASGSNSAWATDANAKDTAL